MSRGLGDRGRDILSKLETARGWVPLHELADDPDDPNEMAKARSAVRILRRRGLVDITRMADPSRYIETTVIMGSLGEGFQMHYGPERVERVWHGMWARIRDDEPLEEILLVPLPGERDGHPGELGGHSGR